MIIKGVSYPNELETIIKMSTGGNLKNFMASKPRLIISKDIVVKPYGAKFFEMLKNVKYELLFKKGKYVIKYDGKYIPPAKIFLEWLEAGIEFETPISDLPVDEVIEKLREVVEDGS